MAMPMASSAKVVTLGGFKYRVASLYVVGAAMCDTLTCFITSGKSLCVIGAIFLHLCILRGRRSTLENSVVILRGRRSAADVSCCMFLQITLLLLGLREVVTRCKLRRRCGTP